VLANGQLLRGHSGVAGHLGHLTVDADGPVCVCGNRGCLETVFSARAIEGEVWRPCIAAAPPRSPACSATSPTGHLPHIFQAMSEGDSLALRSSRKPFASWARPSPACSTSSIPNS